MTRFDYFVSELQQLVPFRIRYKDESWEMQLLNLVALWFCPDFMTRYTTVIGSTIYLPSREYVEVHGDSVLRTLAHEVVHMLDAERWSEPGFMFLYLTPQIFALGILLFPFFGFWALLFLLFLLPIPSPFRFYFESRGYAMDVLTAEEVFKERTLQRCVEHFQSWDYYMMFPFPQVVERTIRYWVNRAERGHDKTLLKVLLVYEVVNEDG